LNFDGRLNPMERVRQTSGTARKARCPLNKILVSDNRLAGPYRANCLPNKRKKRRENHRTAADLTEADVGGIGLMEAGYRANKAVRMWLVPGSTKFLFRIIDKCFEIGISLRGI